MKLQAQEPAAAAFAAARKAQQAWAACSLKERLRILRKFRGLMAEEGGELSRLVLTGFRENEGEALASEVAPLLDACRFLEKKAPALLRPQVRKGRFLPFGLKIEERRDPFGVVLIIGPENYPLFLAGVQAIQTLTAGNAAIVKPGAGGGSALEMMARLATEAGFPEGIIHILPESLEAAKRALACGPDKVVMTGSAENGRAVLGTLAETLTPATMELSGCDAVFVRKDADLKRVVDVIRFGLTWNRSATCIAPRRVLVMRELAGELRTRLVKALENVEAMPLPDANVRTLRESVAKLEESGASLLAGRIEQGKGVTPHVLACRAGQAPALGDVFAPITVLTEVKDDDEALALNRECPYALGAIVFGRNPGAGELARRIDAGCVTVNDAIAPTADPWVSFGGRHRSGFGVTRGPWGLLDLTVLKVIAVRRGRFLPHLLDMTPEVAMALESVLALQHGRSIKSRVNGLRNLIQSIKRNRRKS